MISANLVKIDLSSMTWRVVDDDHKLASWSISGCRGRDDVLHMLLECLLIVGTFLVVQKKDSVRGHGADDVDVLAFRGRPCNVRSLANFRAPKLPSAEKIHVRLVLVDYYSALINERLMRLNIIASLFLVGHLEGTKRFIFSEKTPVMFLEIALWLIETPAW